MEIETIVQIGGALLLSVVVLRATVATMSFADQNAKGNMRARREMRAFRAKASEVLQQFTPQMQPHSVAASNGKRQFRVVKRVYENLKGDICSFYLEPVDRQPIPSYRPGQFLTFELNIPGARQPVTRCYSLSQCPTDPQTYYRVSIKRLAPPPNAQLGVPPGLSSSFFHEQLGEGQIVEAYPPAGDFCLDHASNRPVVFIAGGVGVTPLISMLNWLAAMQSQREIWFFYCVRDRTEHAFYAQLKAISERMPNVRSLVFYSRPSPTCRQGIDYDFNGRVNVDIIRQALTANNYQFYVCGSASMMQSITTELRKWGVPEADVFTESFGVSAGPAPTVAPSPAIQGGPAAGRAKGTSFRINFAKSKKTVTWTPRNGSLLELAEAAGVNARCACRAGMCGTCKTAIKKGDVGYASPPQAQLQSGYCLPCVARPTTDLVLDL